MTISPHSSSEPSPQPSLQPHIKLDQFLKQMQVVGSGGQAKLLIQSGQVKVNGVVEARRGRKLYTGDRVEFQNDTFEVNLSPFSNLP